MKRFGLFFLFWCLVAGLFAQEKSTANGEPIQIVYGANFTKDEAKYPGASIFTKDDRQVQFKHNGADMWCDIAILYQEKNQLKAMGNIRLNQGDTITLTGGRLDYDGETKLAKSWKEVVLQNNEMTLTTDTLYFDRNQQEAYYNFGGKVVDAENTLTSIVGRYFMELKKYEFIKQVHIDNPDYTLKSAKLDYYTESNQAYLYGPSTIIGDEYRFYCERGFYNLHLEQGYGIKKTKIHYSNRIIEGDSVYFNKSRKFASATNHIVITDTINKGIIRAHYAEVFKEKDSLFATKKAVSISLVENDSLYMHGDTLMVTGKPDNRILRAFKNAKFYKKDLSGKCDSIHYRQKSGITQLIRRPIIWNGDSQMTGDSIYLLSDPKTKKMDSLKVINNAFIIALDTVEKKGYNQAKGKILLGKFKNNSLKHIDLIQNTEVIYYVYDDDKKLLGINKAICSKVGMEMGNNDIDEISFIISPDGNVIPLKQIPIEERKLEGFVWYGPEQIRSPKDLFDYDDLHLILPVIQGLNNEMDVRKKPIKIPITEKQ